MNIRMIKKTGRLVLSSLDAGLENSRIYAPPILKLRFSERPFRNKRIDRKQSSSINEVQPHRDRGCCFRWTNQYQRPFACGSDVWPNHIEYNLTKPDCITVISVSLRFQWTAKFLLHTTHKERPDQHSIHPFSMGTGNELYRCIFHAQWNLRNSNHGNTQRWKVISNGRTRFTQLG